MYKYPIDQCDVLDKAKITEYREKRSAWIDHLCGEDPHAIWKQIPQMFWHDMVFRAVNETRRLAAANPKPDVAFNEAVIRLFDAGYVATQTTAIRRLTERWPPRSGQRDPNRAVISLPRFLFEIRESLPLVTREVYVSLDGLPYDPAPLERACLEKSANEALLKAEDPDFEESSGWLDTDGPNAWMTSQIVHEHFDKLSGVTPEKRQRTDTIRPVVVESC